MLFMILILLDMLIIYATDNHLLHDQNKPFRHGGKLYSETRKYDCHPSNGMYGMDDKKMKGNFWFQKHWEPCISCASEERIGLPGDGGKWICNPVRELQKGACLVMSLGSNNEFSFESEIIERFQCDVHIFDHTSKPPSPETIPAHILKHIFFHPFGVSDANDFNSTRTKPVDVLYKEYILAAYPQKNYDMIDIMKMDIESWEYFALREPQLMFLSEKVIQLSIEIHVNHNIPGLGILMTTADLADLWRRFAAVAHFFPFHKEPNIENSCGLKCMCVEYSMLNGRYVVKYNTTNHHHV